MSNRWLELIESGPCKGTFRLCGEHLPADFVKPGQTWVGSRIYSSLAEANDNGVPWAVIADHLDKHYPCSDEVNKE